jgi:hypothetical protein
MEGPCTPRKYRVVLVHEITKYDAAVASREAKRGRVNIYRLGLLLQAVERVEADVATKLDSSSPEAIADFRMALYKHFERDFPPVKKVVKQIEAGVCEIR